ncbi:hypothetical protein [Sandarakinorhabdus sp. AAP62]|uniref:hypothetical protein n=1 Tax=Sandarakinorhabdus sp. AAP62 TaxID=1248916 RepID=UPI001267002B|nr:hypothetical protein [Sandarakinorhabdus sp. AAP62]
MTAMVATSPPARSHAVKAVRHALRRTPPPPPAPAAPGVVSSTPLNGGCENLPRLAALAVPMDDVTSLPAAALANSVLGASNALPPGLSLDLAPLGGLTSFAPAPPAMSDLLPLSGAPDLGQWMQMMIGFGLIGSTVRVRRRSQA